jgi:hypothetical protein
MCRGLSSLAFFDQPDRVISACSASAGQNTCLPQLKDAWGLRVGLERGFEVGTGKSIALRGGLGLEQPHESGDHAEGHYGVSGGLGYRQAGAEVAGAIGWSPDHLRIVVDFRAGF